MFVSVYASKSVLGGGEQNFFSKTMSYWKLFTGSLLCAP